MQAGITTNARHPRRFLVVPLIVGIKNSQTEFRQWRLRMGFTQRQAANALRYSVSQIAEYDRGSQTPPWTVLLVIRNAPHIPELLEHAA